EVVKEGAAIDVAAERPADRMDDPARLVSGRFDLPQLLDADAEGLRIDPRTQIEALDQRLGERAAAALREQGETPMQLDPSGEICRWLPVPADTHISRSDAFHPSVLVIENLGSGK